MSFYARGGRGGGGRGRGGRGRGGYREANGGQRDPEATSGHRGDGAARWSEDDSDGARDAPATVDSLMRGGAPSSGLPCAALYSFLRSVDGSNYGQLKQLTGKVYSLTERLLPSREAATVQFIRIQPDPFAPGSQVCVTVAAPFCVQALLRSSPPTPGQESSAPVVLSGEDVAWRRVAAEDYVLRCLTRGLAERRASSALQLLSISQHILPRSTVQLVDAAMDGAAPSPGAPDGYLRIFLRVKLPGHGRRIDGEGIHRILFSELLPAIQRHVLQCSRDELWAHVTSVSDQEWLRRQLPQAGLVAFIADGAVLPRAAGDSDAPLRGAHVVPFTSPPSLSRTFALPFSGRVISGAGLPRGLTLIAGGGFHGKSTLLRALELGVYNHIPDDGRTFVVVDPTAVKIRAEDRRSVHGVDISPFIGRLPYRDDTSTFATTDASGSTSQATNIMEALELGSTALLLDEDTSATNFMYRDALMEQLVPLAQEPITSFVHRVRDLMHHHRVSVIMVVGGSGQYFPMADLVLVMNAYHVRDATEEARSIVKRSSGSGLLEAAAAGSHSETSAFSLPPQRHFDYARSFSELSRHANGRGLKTSGSGRERLRFGDETIELGLVEQLVEEGQLNGIAQCLAMLYDGGVGKAEEMQGQRLPSPPPSSTPPSLLPLLLSTPARGAMASASDGGGGHPTAAPALSHYGTLVYNCEQRLRQARLELQTPSCYLPAGFTALPRVFELGAALNRLRTLVTARR